MYMPDRHFFIPAGIEGKYIASLQNPWKYAWIGFYADNGNKFIDLLFGKNEILDLALSAKELEKRNPVDFVSYG